METRMEQARPGRADAVRGERAGSGGGGLRVAAGGDALSAAAHRANAGPHASSLAQLRAVVAQRACAGCETVRRTMGGAPVQRATKEDGGLPGELRAGLEHLSGLDLSGVSVNYDSPRPARLNAHAVAQGPVIDVAPGQERHLPHEGWHAVQQMQNRVRPTMDLGGTPVNDDAGLEREADVMGARALAAGRGAAQLSAAASPGPRRADAAHPVQRKLKDIGSDTVDTPAGAIKDALGIPINQLKLPGKQVAAPQPRARHVSAKVDSTTLRDDERKKSANLGTVTSMARAEQFILQGADVKKFYDAGHLVADQLVGKKADSFQMWNLAPQASEFNAPTYAQIMEEEAREAATGNTVKLEVQLGYPAADAYTVTPEQLLRRGVLVGRQVVGGVKVGTTVIPANELQEKITIPRRVPTAWTLDASVEAPHQFRQVDKPAGRGELAFNFLPDIDTAAPTIGTPFQFSVNMAAVVESKLRMLATNIRKFVARQWSPAAEGVRREDLISLVATTFPDLGTADAIRERLGTSVHEVIADAALKLAHDLGEAMTMLAPAVTAQTPAAWMVTINESAKEATAHIGAARESEDLDERLKHILRAQAIIEDLKEELANPSWEEPEEPASDASAASSSSADGDVHQTFVQPAPEPIDLDAGGDAAVDDVQPPGGGVMAVPADEDVLMAPARDTDTAHSAGEPAGSATAAPSSSMDVDDSGPVASGSGVATAVVPWGGQGAGGGLPPVGLPPRLRFKFERMGAGGPLPTHDPAVRPGRKPKRKAGASDDEDDAAAAAVAVADEAHRDKQARRHQPDDER